MSVPSRRDAKGLAPYAVARRRPLAGFLRSPIDNRQLIFRLIQREIVGRYRGSFAGLAWSFITPLIMLVLYTFVFSVVFKAKWKDFDTGSGFALILFSGLIVHGVVAECINRSPSLITSNANYVKKVVFPLEVYAWVTLGSAMFHAFISWIVLTIAQLCMGVALPWTIILFPLVMLPLLLGCLGVSWFLAAIGVYFRDVAQITGTLATLLLFLSPVFYSLDSIPERYRPLIQANPLTGVLEAARDVLMFGNIPSATYFGVSLAVGLVVAVAGYAFFQKSRDGFADVI